MGFYQLDIPSHPMRIKTLIWGIDPMVGGDNGAEVAAGPELYILVIRPQLRE